MALTRRQFITRTGLAAAGSFLSPSIFRNPFLRRALADTIGDRFFIVIFLDGGNDGLNTVTPVANGTFGNLRTAYTAARPTGSAGSLQLLPADLAATTIGNCPSTHTPLALHPGFSGLKHLYDLGKVAVIQGVGYPDYSLSHEIARRSWQSGIPNGFTAGWVGRYLAANYSGSDIPALNVTYDIAGEFQTTATSVLAIRRLADFGFPYDNFSSADAAAKKACFQALYNSAKGAAQPPTLQFEGDAGTATLAATDSYPPLDDLYTTARKPFSDAYDALGTSTASDLREIAKVIYGVNKHVTGVNARFFELRNGGYDTHSNQGAADPNGQHYGLHKELGDALKTFYDDITDMGVANKVGVMVWSEFSRRIQQNDSGTDHGSQGPVFVIGGAVTGGVYGAHPNINDAALNDDGNTVYSQAVGDPYRSTDLRDVYGTILAKWLNMPDPLAVLPVDSGDPALYWTSPNFNLGFL